MKLRCASILVLVATPLLAQESLLEARKGHTTKLTREEKGQEKMPAPPPELFALVEYPGPLGKYKAYLGKPPEPGKKYPAILWITGGFPPGGMDSAAWEPVGADNDQSAKAYRLAGVVTMYPTFRGSYGNPGVQETFFGEVDDALAALEYLRKVEWVDPARIYVGGHSTGGTMALLVAAATDELKGVLSFGPIDDPTEYGADSLTFDASLKEEARLRSPIHWLGGIKAQTFVIEGSARGNADALRAMEKATKNPKLRFLAVKGANHFDLLAPINQLIAQRIAKLPADQPLELSLAELEKACDEQRAVFREAGDLEQLAATRREGVDIHAAQQLRWYLLAREKGALTLAGKEAGAQGFDVRPPKKETDEDGSEFFVVVIAKKLVPADLKGLFATSAAVAKLAAGAGVQYGGWDAGK